MNPSASAQIPAEGRMAGYAPVYYPGTADLASAVEVTVGPGEERTGIDFVLPLVPIARIAGTVIRADGLPAQGAQVNLRAAGMSSLSAALDTIQLRAVADASGRFVLPSVKPGQYTVIALAASRPTAAPAPPGAGGGGIAPGRLAVQAGSMDLYARSELVVTGQDVEDLNITLQPGATLSGRVVYEATTLASSAEPLRASIQLMPPTLAAILRMSGADTYSAVVNADASFSLSVAPGTWALNATPITTPADAWFLKSIQLRGQDVTDTPLDVRGGSDISGIVVTLSDRSAEISGSFVDATGKPAPGYFVAVFPVDRPNWGALVRRFKPPSLPSTDGKFRVTGLPPGDYYVAALTDIDPIDMLDESFVQKLIPAAFRITLREGEKKVQDFRIK
jgi:hypothetical protein